MRPPKSRSRSKSNRSRSVGNVINRVFDSSGPEGKVRGTPQQIIDKYNQLARDSQLGNDRVAAENFQQHAEHYLRILAEAQREAEAKREAAAAERQNHHQQDRHHHGHAGNANAAEATQNPGTGPQPDLIDSPYSNNNDKSSSMLVVTPEDSTGEQETAAPASEVSASTPPAALEAANDAVKPKEAADEPAPSAKPRRGRPARSANEAKAPRAPRKPRAKKSGAADVVAEGATPEQLSLPEGNESSS